MKISVITPTCFRPQLFKEMCESLLSTTKDYDIQHVIVIDEDKETLEIAKSFPWYDVSISYSGEKRGALDSWNYGLKLSQGEIIFAGMDDLIFHPKWLDYALESHEKQLNGYGVVGMNDLAYDETQVATQWIFDRQFCKDHMGGIFAPPIYEYLCVDLHWEGVAKMTGNYYRDMRAKVEHKHSAHGKRPFDKIDEAKDEGLVQRDMATYAAQLSQGFPISWDSVI